MGGLVAHIAELEGHRGSELVLDGYVPLVDGGHTHFQRAHELVHARRQREQTARGHAGEDESRRPGGQVEGRQPGHAPGAPHLLGGQHRQVLGDRVAERAAEDPEVEAAAVAEADNGFLRSLIGDAEAGSEVLERVLDVAVAPDVAHATHANHAGLEIDPSPGRILGNGLRIIDLPAQAVGDGPLGAGAPGVLAVEEPPMLPFGRVGDAADVAVEEPRVTQEEAGQT